MTDQWYLIESREVPPQFCIFDNKPIKGRRRIIGDFRYKLTPLGTQLFEIEIKVTEDTKFAGVLWGNGDTFDPQAEAPQGILGELDMISRSAPCIRFADSTTLPFPSNFEEEGRQVTLVPPELFGLTRQCWWEDKFLWKSASS
ncbi:MAG: hypothetical protein AAF092_03625 [Pseudomonadota bacterium]